MTVAPESVKRSYPGSTRAIVLLLLVFFAFGLLTSLNNILVPHFKDLFGLGFAGSALVPFAFFSAYLLASLPSGWVLSKLGYPSSLALGLVISAVGAILFYPAAALLSYPLFLGGLFVLASGITLLQVAGNPYATLLGNPASASSRLNLVQAFNSVGTTVAPYLGGVWILARASRYYGYDRQGEATVVQTPYVVLGALLLVLAACARWGRLPEIHDGPVHDVTSNVAAVPLQRPPSFLQALRVRRLRLGVLAIFLYVGAEVAIGTFLVNFIMAKGISNLTAPEAAGLVAYYWGGAMVGRFIGAAVLARFDPRKTLAACAAVAAILVALGGLVGGRAAIVAVIGVGLFNSIQFPTIFSLAIDGLGDLASRGSSLLVMAVVGGAIVPFVLGVIADRIGVHHAYVVLSVCYLVIVHYGLRGSRPVLPRVPGRPGSSGYPAPSIPEPRQSR